MKYILILIILNNFLSANIQNIKNEFSTNVIEVNIYKRRFKNYLKKHCPSENIKCLIKKIDSIKSWESTQKDYILQKRLKKRKKLIHVDKKYLQKINIKINKKFKKLKLKQKQFLSIIDLSKQLIILVLYKQNKTLEYIGSDLISSGNMKREIEIKYGESHYFNSPTGLFKAKRGWRSIGEYKDDKVSQGFGKKGRYIFYFGKIKAKRYNTFNSNKTKIKNKEDWKIIDDYLQFAMHANESSNPKGKAYSHGCIRVTNELNIFMDNNMFLHKKSFFNNKWNNPYSNAPQNMQNKNYTGQYLVIEKNFL